MNNNKFIFRTAKNQDIPKIVDLVKMCLDEFNLVYSPKTSEKDLSDIELTYIKNGGTFEIIENDRYEIIGTIALLKISQSKGKLRKMYVDKRYRNVGLGKKLMDIIIKKALLLKFEKLTLETVHSMTSAIGLYKKYGFKIVKNNLTDSPRCNIVMHKQIK